MITLAYTLGLIPLWAYLNRVRGNPNKPVWLPNKVTCYLAMWVSLLPLCYEQYLIAPIVFVALWISFSMGWGRYFPHGWNTIPNTKIDVYKETEVGLIDWITDMIVGKWNKPRDYGFVRKWQTLAMSLRFGLTVGLVFFPSLAFVTGNWWLLLGFPASFACGLIYAYFYRNHYDYAYPIEKKHRNEVLVEYFVGAYLAFIIFLCYFIKIL